MFFLVKKCNLSTFANVNHNNMLALKTCRTTLRLSDVFTNQNPVFMNLSLPTSKKSKQNKYYILKRLHFNREICEFVICEE